MDRLIGMTREEFDRAIEEGAERGARRALQRGRPGAASPEDPPESLDHQRWWHNEEALRYLQVSRSTLQRWRDSGRLPYSKVGGLIWYRRDDIYRLLEDGMGQ